MPTTQKPKQTKATQKAGGKSNITKPQTTTTQKAGGKSNITKPQTTTTQKAGGKSNITKPQTTTTQKAGGKSNITKPQTTTTQKAGGKSNITKPQTTTTQKAGGKSKTKAPKDEGSDHPNEFANIDEETEYWMARIQGNLCSESNICTNLNCILMDEQVKQILKNYQHNNFEILECLLEKLKMQSKTTSAKIMANTTKITELEESNKPELTKLRAQIKRAEKTGDQQEMNNTINNFEPIHIRKVDELIRTLQGEVKNMNKEMTNIKFYIGSVNFMKIRYNNIVMYRDYERLNMIVENITNIKKIKYNPGSISYELALQIVSILTVINNELDIKIKRMEENIKQLFVVFDSLSEEDKSNFNEYQDKWTGKINGLKELPTTIYKLITEFKYQMNLRQPVPTKPETSHMKPIANELENVPNELETSNLLIQQFVENIKNQLTENERELVEDQRIMMQTTHERYQRLKPIPQKKTKQNSRTSTKGLGIPQMVNPYKRIMSKYSKYSK
jgi:hypothetical protein